MFVYRGFTANLLFSKQIKVKKWNIIKQLTKTYSQLYFSDKIQNEAI